jgi:hypothetical protein
MICLSDLHSWSTNKNPYPNLRLRKEKSKPNFRLHAPAHRHTCPTRCLLFYVLAFGPKNENGEIVQYLASVHHSTKAYYDYNYMLTYKYCTR